VTSIRELVARYYEAVWVGGDADACDELLSDDYVDHDPPLGFGSDKTAAKDLVRAVTTGMSDHRFDLLDVIVERDRAAAHWVWEWTHHGDWLGLPADGRRITLRGHDFYRYANGRIAEIWHCDDFLGAFRQLGAVVSTPAAATSYQGPA
jgi:steroid delta-isomerase-like uncharacterized protein